MKNRYQFIFVSALIILTSGCSLLKNLNGQTSYTELNNNDSVVVLGVNPRYRVRITRGYDEPNGWRIDPWSNTRTIYPEDGYIVTKLPRRRNDSTYAITAVLPNGLFKEQYPYCQEQMTLTFETTAGKIVYLGNIDFQITGSGKVSGSSFEFSVTKDIEAAREFLKNEYPSFEKHLVQGNYTTRNLLDGYCPSIWDYLPIFPVWF